MPIVIPGSTPANIAGTDQWPVYLDFEEVWEYLQIDNAPPDPVKTKLQRYINSACTIAQEGANRPFGPVTFRERHDGWSGEYIQLHYSPFLKLVLCREWQSSGGFVTLPESTPDNPVEGIQIDYGTSRVMRTFTGYSWPRPFFPGSRNVEFTYVAGFNPVPHDVWEATADLVGYKWRNSQEAPRWFGQNEEYGGPATNMLYPGVPNRIAEVFERYRLPTIG